MKQNFQAFISAEGLFCAERLQSATPAQVIDSTLTCVVLLFLHFLVFDFGRIPDVQRSSSGNDCLSTTCELRFDSKLGLSRCSFRARDFERRAALRSRSDPRRRGHARGPGTRRRRGRRGSRLRAAARQLRVPGWVNSAQGFTLAARCLAFSVTRLGTFDKFAGFPKIL